MKKIFLVLLSALPVLTTAAQDFPLVSQTQGATPIYVDPQDHWLVKKVASMFCEDVERITGTKPLLLHTLPEVSIPRLIIIGSRDSSAIIRQLLEKAALSAKQTGKWEAYTRKTLRHPTPRIGEALIIAGSDRRGTAYGVLQLSRQLGVSPWYYWADVPTQHKDELYCKRTFTESDGPAIKYRGFFINDEAPALSGWVHTTFGNFNHLFYEHVFELLLRLKANYLWPAMWGNAFNDDDTLNPILASRYGIVMGTSHHEPMLRAQQEWKRYGSGPWDYTTNAAVLDSFWEKGIVHMDQHESIVTIGMRGDGDKPMTEGSNIALLEKIVADQRNMIHKVTGKDPAATPQSWALYKEVQDYYDKGMRVPDDVTLLLCDDNWGNVRKLPISTDKPRTGGYGLYYHFDYVGGPRNYKWINTNPLPRAWEELHLTKEYGVDKIWIVNVGDIKPLEFPTQFFLDYAWDPSAIPAQGLADYTFQWATAQFGPDHAADIADILAKYAKYNGRRKPELLSPDTYSLFNYREAQSVVSDYKLLAEKATAISKQLPAEYHDAYFELVAYPVFASANLNELYYTVALNHLYARQGRVLTDSLAAEAKGLFIKDSLMAYTYNHNVANGKWPHMMDQTHIGYTYWQEPRHNNMPATDTIDLATAKDPTWGIAVEGATDWWPNATTEARLPSFNPYDNAGHFIDIFNRSAHPFTYTITTGEPWIHIDKANPTISTEQRIWVSIDWQKAPKSSGLTGLKITGPSGPPVKIKIILDNPAPPPPASFKGFIETGGCVSIEAEHYSRAVTNPTIQWLTIPDLGRTGSAVQAIPVTAKSITPGGNSPHLEYQVYLFDTGAVNVQAYFSPILEFNRKPIHYAIAFDNEQPQTIDLSTGNEARGSWDKMVSYNIRIVLSKHILTRPGIHTLKVYFVDPGPVLQKLVIDAGGAKPSYLGPPESPTYN
ncbi:glycosyl hydrolase 115 family protein [Puia dinghuensis]|uniref:Gylcosyl hydrolase 115 C-terminal domain-containing protein n=1 Tax=Puia dinghuensis TaxID=1792502 RepID=A0A8J2UAT9_9BACT|nr:glycosyl hydrolase 115 family protein [Puia dinghuensis]GGA90631.1 hypothetical protein GCM10011511_12370 [Puia dinghuensis]